VANNSPAKAGLVKGGSWGISIKREKKTWKKRDPKTRAKTGSRNTEQKNKTQKREGKVKE
jgi:hypothetical protein